MRAAAALGVNVAKTEYVEFDGRAAIVVERFDRIQLPGGSVPRIHQEDPCEATGRMPELEYEEDGGPTSRDLAQILRGHSVDPEPERCGAKTSQQAIDPAPSGRSGAKTRAPTRSRM